MESTIKIRKQTTKKYKSSDVVWSICIEMAINNKVVKMEINIDLNSPITTLYPSIYANIPVH